LRWRGPFSRQPSARWRDAGAGGDGVDRRAACRPCDTHRPARGAILARERVRGQGDVVPRGAAWPAVEVCSARKGQPCRDNDRGMCVGGPAWRAAARRSGVGACVPEAWRAVRRRASGCRCYVIRRARAAASAPPPCCAPARAARSWLAWRQRRSA
jgi:hypothetical protein